MNEMRVASIELAAYLVSSAERRSMTSMRSLVRVNGAYSARSVSMARLSSAPTTTRSVLHEVVERVAFLEELGVRSDRELLAGVLADDRFRSCQPVPTGTVDLVTMTATPGQRRAHGLGGLEDEREIGAAVLAGRPFPPPAGSLGTRDPIGGRRW